MGRGLENIDTLKNLNAHRAPCARTMPAEIPYIDEMSTSIVIDMMRECLSSPSPMPWALTTHISLEMESIALENAMGEMTAKGTSDNSANRDVILEKLSPKLVTTSDSVDGLGHSLVSLDSEELRTMNPPRRYLQSIKPAILTL